MVKKIMGQEVLMDQNAKSFIEKACEWRERRYRWCRRAWVLPLPQILIWGLYFYSTPSAHRPAWWLMSLISILFPPTLLIVAIWWINGWPAMRNLRLDRDEGRLMRLEGAFFKGLILPLGSLGEDIWVQGQRVRVSSRIHKELPQEGTGIFFYFPRTRLCWTCNGAEVWQPGEAPWW